MKCPFAEEIVYTIKERQYFEQIEKAYNYASKLLLDLLMEEKELMARLRWAQELCHKLGKQIFLVGNIFQSQSILQYGITMYTPVHAMLVFS